MSKKRLTMSLAREGAEPWAIEMDVPDALDVTTEAFKAQYLLPALWNLQHGPKPANGNGAKA